MLISNIYNINIVVVVAVKFKSAGPSPFQSQPANQPTTPFPFSKPTAPFPFFEPNSTLYFFGTTTAIPFIAAAIPINVNVTVPASLSTKLTTPSINAVKPSVAFKTTGRNLSPSVN